MIKNAFFFSLLIAASLAFIAMLTPFFEPILWSVTLAILFQPIHTRLCRRFSGRQNLAAFSTLLLIIMVVIAPSLFLFTSMAQEGLSLYQALANGDIDISQAINWIQASLPSVTAFAENLGIDIEQTKQKLSASALASGQWLASHLLTFGQNTMRFAMYFFLMLYLLFFFLRDGGKIVEMIIDVLPIGDQRERDLLDKFAEVSKATIKGTLVVGIIQGSLGGIMFALLGIQSAIFWGVIMTLLSILPAIGSALVWLPAALYLIANGMLLKGLIMILVGSFVIGMVDNILRPILVGRDTKMPDYLILLSTLGGLGMIGISGFVLGPVIAAFFLAIWAMFARDFNPDNIPS